MRIRGLIIKKESKIQRKVELSNEHMANSECHFLKRNFCKVQWSSNPYLLLNKMPLVDKLDKKKRTNIYVNVGRFLLAVSIQSVLWGLANTAWSRVILVDLVQRKFSYQIW